MQIAQGAPALLHSFRKFPSPSNTWMRLFSRSPTSTLPCIGGDAMQGVKFALRRATLTPFFDPVAVLIEFHHARVSVPVGDETVTGSVPSNVGGPVEEPVGKGRKGRWRRWGS
jgi:hypothetical protein